MLVAAWAIGGLYASLGPSLLVDVFGVDNHLAGGLLIFALNGTGVLGSLALRGAAPPRALVIGALVFAVGVGGTVAVAVRRLASRPCSWPPSSPASGSAAPSSAPSR